MRKLLLTLGLIGFSVLAHAQGIFIFGNSALTGIQFVPCRNYPFDERRLATAADGLWFSVWFGPAGSSEEELVRAGSSATIGRTPGVLVNAPLTFALPGTEGGQVVSLQIRVDGDYFPWGRTPVKQVTLGSPPSPGTVIWQTTAGTNPNRFYPMVVFECIPEPPSVAVLGLCAVAGAIPLFRVRKSIKAD